MTQRKKLKAPVVDVLEQMQPSKSELMLARRVALQHAIARMQADRSTPVQQLITSAQTWKIPMPPEGVVPKSAMMAMDDAAQSYSGWAMQNSLFAEGQAFLGYPYLSELSQRPEYRVISETWAQEMTRKWIKIVSTGDTELDDKTQKIKDIENAFTVFNIKQHIKKCIEVDGFFGRAQLFIDLGVDTKNREELKSTLGASTSRLMKAKVRKGMLKGFKVIEPVWTYPNSYNANDPLKEDFFKPVTWFVMGQEIHSTRLLTFIGKPMPDLLKPMYAFGGLSLSQMAKPYVDNWLRTRQSVSDGISNFSIMILLTDMQSMMNDGAALDLETRADFFNVARDNRGLMLADKNSEDLKNVSMPISGLDHLQAQAQEHMCLAKGTLIETARGQIPVEDVDTDDQVMTRHGYAPVAWSGVTGYTSHFVEIATSVSTLRVTREHPVWSEKTKEFVSAKSVNSSHCLRKSRAWESTGSQLHGEAGCGAKQKQDTTATLKQEGCSIVSSIKHMLERFQQVLMCITGMKTHCLRKSRAWESTGSQLHGEAGCGAKQKQDTTATLKQEGCSIVSSIKHMLERFQQVLMCITGMKTQATTQSATLCYCHAQSTPKHTDSCKVNSSNTQRSVLSAETNTQQHGQAEHSTVQTLARAECGKDSIQITGTRVVKTEYTDEPVYNLKVVDGYLPEFFANGLLVHNCSVSQIPLVKLTGISPSGLNASSEGEIRVFYDKVEASQEAMLRGHLTTILNVIQLHLYGEIDPEITFEFEKLYSVDDTEAATMRKTECDTDIAYINAGVISPQESRVRLAADRESPYASLDTSEEALPQNPQEQQQPGEETDEQGNPLSGLLGAQAPQGGQPPADGGDKSQQPPAGQPHSTAGAVSQGAGASNLQKRPITSQPVAAHDDWNEELHPRGQPTNKGEFAKTAGGGGSAQAKKSQQHGEQLEAPHTLPDDSPLLKDSREDKSEAAQKERYDIEQSVFEGVKPVTGRRPIIYMMAGGGAAGKGTLKKQLIEQGKIPAFGVVSVDPDEIKMSMKRYKDIAATGDSRASPTVHEDGSNLSKSILKRAAAGKYDVVYDATMSDFKKGLEKIQEFKNKGYDVHMFNVTMTDPEVAVQRAIDRFKKTGRWLDPDVLREAHKNFAKVLKQYEHTADYYETYNSDDGFKMLESSKTVQPHIEGMPVDADGNVTLTHYSDVGGLQQLDPVAYGSGLKGSEAKRKEADPENWVERTYHGVDVGNEGGYKKEAGLGSHVYQTKIPAHLMYDYQHDPDGLFQKAPEGHNPLSMYEKAIKDSGYQGYYVNHQSLGKVAATFYPMDATEVQNTAQDENPNHDPHNGEFTTGSNAGEKDSFQQRLKELRVPPAWRDVMVNKSPDAELQAIGTDEKGRKQYLYSAAHSEKAAAEKFARLNAFHNAEAHITSTAFSDMQDSKLSPKQRDTAAVLALISQTGFRLGSDDDTGAEVQAYGASNMLGSHVQVHGSTLVFDFTGKKGVEQNHTINNVALAQYIGNKKRRVGDGRLFNTTEGNVRGYMKSVGGDDFKVKDYRTYVGTSKALEEVSKLPVPTTQTQYKKFRNMVGDAVSSVLGNSRTMALNAYINPAVFAPWGFQT